MNADLKCTVLIVDDDVDLCTLLNLSLKTEYNVEYCHSLEAAKSLLSDHIPEILFLDNSLPDGYGIEFLQELMRAHICPRVIFMTADEGQDLEQNALSRGAVRFLSKPFIIAEIKKIIPQIMAA